MKLGKKRGGLGKKVGIVKKLGKGPRRTWGRKGET